MTKREWIKAAVLGACGAVLTGSSSPAAEEPPPGDDLPENAKSSDESLCVEDIVTAYAVADWGRRMDPPSPLALCSAAEMLLRTHLIPVDSFGNKDRFKGPVSTLKQDPWVLWPDADKLLDEAVKMAKEYQFDVKRIQAVVQDVNKRPRGVLDGPLMFTTEVAAGQTDPYQFKYKHGEWARIAIRNCGDAVLQLNVVTDHGDPRGDDRQLHPRVAFVPLQKDGAEFTVTVTNRGKTKTVYHLFTNRRLRRNPT